MTYVSSSWSFYSWVHYELTDCWYTWGYGYHIDFGLAARNILFILQGLNMNENIFTIKIGLVLVALMAIGLTVVCLLKILPLAGILGAASLIFNTVLLIIVEDILIRRDYKEKE